MILSTFLLYEQRGKIGKVGKVELFVIGFTFLMAISISIIMIRKGNK